LVSVLPGTAAAYTVYSNAAWDKEGALLEVAIRQVFFRNRYWYALGGDTCSSLIGSAVLRAYVGWRHSAFVFSQIVDSWLKEARLLLETRQAVESLSTLSKALVIGAQLEK